LTDQSKHGLAQVPCEFAPNSKEVLDLMTIALKQRNGNCVQAYADLVSALTAFAMLNDRNVWDITSHVAAITPQFQKTINKDKDGMAASLGLFKSTKFRN